MKKGLVVSPERDIIKNTPPAAFAEDFQKRSQKKGKEVDRLGEERI
ncbi:hypothetical protein ACRQ5I_05505 [Pseudoramibacter alactolyticus]|jgi:hypothetical protein